MQHLPRGGEVVRDGLLLLRQEVATKVARQQNDAEHEGYVVLQKRALRYRKSRVHQQKRNAESDLNQYRLGQSSLEDRRMVREELASRRLFVDKPTSRARPTDCPRRAADSRLP
jgi:hypothetical protein